MCCHGQSREKEKTQGLLQPYLLLGETVLFMYPHQLPLCNPSTTCVFVGKEPLQQNYITCGADEGEKEKTVISKWCHPRSSAVLMGARQ